MTSRQLIQHTDYNLHTKKKKVKKKNKYFKAGWQKSENTYIIPFYNG